MYKIYGSFSAAVIPIGSRRSAQPFPLLLLRFLLLPLLSNGNFIEPFNVRIDPHSITVCNTLRNGQQSLLPNYYENAVSIIAEFKMFATVTLYLDS